MQIQMEKIDQTRGKRMTLLDELRGLAILNMIAYHLCYDLAVLYRLDMPWFSSVGAAVWQGYICISFLMIAGISTAFTRHPYRRVLKVALCAAVITAVTSLLMPGHTIWFGILHCMAVSMLVTAPFRRSLTAMPKIAGLSLSLLLILLTWNVSQGYLGFESLLTATLPEAFYDIIWLSPLGFQSAEFRSADYFPLLPYFFVFLAGFFAAERVRDSGKWAYRTRIRPLAFLGRHSLLIYMLHQPVLLGILTLIFPGGRPV